MNFGFDLLNKSTMTSAIFLYTHPSDDTHENADDHRTFGIMNLLTTNQKQVRQWMTIAAAGMVLTLLLLGFFTLDSSLPFPYHWQDVGANSRIIGAARLSVRCLRVSAFTDHDKTFSYLCRSNPVGIRYFHHFFLTSSHH